MASTTTALSPDDLPEEPNLRYHPIPHRTAEHAGKKRSVWRIRFDVVTSPGKRFGLDINDEIVLGRGMDSTNIVDMTPYLGEELGVSRRHLILRPTATNLFAIDTGSKNGTLRNGQSIGVNAPYPINDGDLLNMGRLQVEVHIVDRPALQPEKPGTDVLDMLSQLVQAITSQREISQVFNRITETAMQLTQAGETGIWLVDDQTQELFLEATRGIEDERISLLRIPPESDSPVPQVIKSGQPMRAQREPGKEKIKIKTTYLVEALLFVPINLGGVTIGALMAVHRNPSLSFTADDERLLMTIADFAAIAIQNARQFQATDVALDRRVKELAAINELTGAVSSSLDLHTVQEMVVRHVRSHWDVEDVILWLEDETDGNLYPFNEEEETVTRIVHNAGGQVETIIRAVQETREPKAADFLGQEGEGGGGGKRATIQIQARSMACVPLIIQGRVGGILSLFRKKSGMFNADDLDRLQSFANPVATAVENARLFQTSERQRAAIQATANALLQPLLILDENGDVLISNGPAQEIIDRHMAELFNGISRSIGSTTEIQIGERTYLTTSHHTPAVGTIVIMQDITYVKKLEQGQADFVYTLTHDLKSPVTSIKGWAQLVEQVTKLDEKGERFVEQIIASSDRMLQMITQMLKVASQVETIDLVKERCDFNAVVTQVINEVEGAALHKRINVDFDTNSTEAWVLGDRDRLYHMTLNLVSNAVKYSPTDQEVKIKLSLDNTGIRLHVRDQGQGIPEEELPYIFDKFYRAANQPKGSGAGLGLSVVKTVVEAHGGKVGAKNMAPNGAEFIVVFPPSMLQGPE